ncbi:cytochrome P450 2C31-like [Gastrophryne carolinensis]
MELYINMTCWWSVEGFYGGCSMPISPTLSRRPINMLCFEHKGTDELYNTFPSVLRWLPGLHKKALQNADEVRTFVRETFTAQRNELDINDQRNLIDAFLVKQEEKQEHFSNENLTELVMDLFAAGISGPSTTLRWGIVLMIKYPDIQRKVQNEIEKVIGSSVPQTKHRKEMPYTNAVIHEIQRFGNIAPANFPHCTTQDVRFRGYYIPKGTTIITLLTSVLYDETQFEKAKEFYPENFLNADGSFVKKEAFMAFSAGERSCAGEELSKMELFLFFVSLLQNFTFKAPPGSKASLEAAMPNSNTEFTETRKSMFEFGEPELAKFSTNLAVWMKQYCQSKYQIKINLMLGCLLFPFHLVTRAKKQHGTDTASGDLGYPLMPWLLMALRPQNLARRLIMGPTAAHEL